MNGLFLDLDGTLADSLGVMRRVYFRFLSDLDRAGSDGEFDSLNGPPLRVIIERLQETHRLDGAIDDLHDRYIAQVADCYRDVAPMDGAKELLAAAQGQGWPIAVVTSNEKKLVTEWLNRTGLDAWIEVIVSGEDVAHGKPDPEPYEAALRQTRCSAPGSIAVEDSLIGATAARAAGLRTFLLQRDGPPDDADTKDFQVITELHQMIPRLSEQD
ncbi:MAG: HAD-IA family hydrolase [Rhodospirillales bacterium]|nr:HAD-IA family hydrolase [Rhodospirillales bacterium]